MNNFNATNFWEGMSHEQINEVKREMQKLMPLVELMKIKARPDSLMGLERDQKLRIMGCTESEIEEMTGFKHKHPVSDFNDETEIFISDKDLPEQFKAAKAKHNAEWNVGYNRYP